MDTHTDNQISLRSLLATRFVTTAAISTGVIAVAFTALAFATTASATTRYAAPGGTASATVCVTPEAAPCSIRTAAAGPGVTAADEAVLAPGQYADADLDSDADGDADTVTPTAGNVHGVVGASRPVITLRTNLGLGAFYVTQGVLARVEIVTSVSNSNVGSEGGVIEDVVARSSRSGATVCHHVPGGRVAIIRDSACLSSGSGSIAVGVGGIGTFNATHTAVLRNVTAVATGANSRGASYRVFGPADWDVDAKALLAQGTQADVAAGANDADVDFVLAHSNYSTVDTSFVQNGGTVDVTPVGADNTNQTEEPKLAADGIHQLPASPTVDAGGAVDQRSGAKDIDGDPRTIGAATDVGADEFAHPTTTVIECPPGPVTAGSGQIECDVTVTDPSPTPIVPAGEVTVSSDSPGQIGPDEACMLVQETPAQAGCTVIYTPQQVASGTHTLEAFFPDYGPHGGSKDQVEVTVLAPPVTQPSDKSGDGPGAMVGPSKRCKRKGKKGKRRKRCRHKRR